MCCHIINVDGDDNKDQCPGGGGGALGAEALLVRTFKEKKERKKVRKDK